MKNDDQRGRQFQASDKSIRLAEGASINHLERISNLQGSDQQLTLFRNSFYQYVLYLMRMSRIV